MNIFDMQEFVSSPLYHSICLAIAKTIPITIISDYSDTMANLDIQRIVNSNLSIKELQNTLINNKDELINYSINKYKMTYIDEEIEDYPIGEEVEERPTNIKYTGYSKGFLLMNLIEYSLMKRGNQELEEYLKKSRIPQAKKYAKEIKSFLELK